ncbi:hypothetical protein AB5J52_43475 [Streptomyces sp. R39]|uniref:Uncharacterized protein n=1 Tax=Streptomyces sp. R39 TaxID=3238631 RepID=A0AB39R1U5_9ACTN
MLTDRVEEPLSRVHGVRSCPGEGPEAADEGGEPGGSGRARPARPRGIEGGRWPAARDCRPRGRRGSTGSSR